MTSSCPSVQGGNDRSQLLHSTGVMLRQDAEERTKQAHSISVNCQADFGAEA